MRPALTVIALTLALGSGRAWAHGGLPVSEAVFVHGKQLIVPTRYWGLFLGTDGGSWQWICEEAVNRDQMRTWAMSGDGTLYANDYSGLDSSRDGGCTWTAASGDIASRAVVGLVGDPVDPKRAWCTTDEGTDQPWNAVFVTTDDGATWSSVYQADEFFRGVIVSADGMTLYAAGIPRQPATAPPVLHVSHDRGVTWNTVALSYKIDGQAPQDLKPLGVDPADPTTAYFAAYADPMRALVKATGSGTTLTQELELGADINGIAFDAAHGAILVPTAKGIYRSVGGQPFAAAGNLSQAQCVTVDGSTLYACASNYAPDNAAVARSSDGVSYAKLFQYADTLGPTSACGPATQVGMVCPPLWEMYASQLGVNLGTGDGGAPIGSDGGVTAPRHGGGCAMGGTPGDGGHRLRGSLALACALLSLYITQRGRRFER